MNMTLNEDKRALSKRLSTGTVALISAIAVQSGAAWAGDLNGDGYDDLVIGAPGDTPSTLGAYSGAGFVFQGGSSGPTAEQLIDQTAFAAGDPGDDFGKAFAMGDFNADGYSDLAVGIPGKDLDGSADAGAVMLFLGSPDGLVAHDLLEQSGVGQNDPDDRFGAALAAGDFDGDCYDDLAVGAPRKAFTAGSRAGGVVLFHGSPDGLIASRYLDQDGMGGNSDGDQFGTSLTAGDYNGDGYDDLVVGAPGESIGSGPESGVAFFFLGSPSGPTPHRYLDQDGMGTNDEGDEFGRALATGDFDGDGYDDLAVGAPGEAIGSGVRAGLIFLFRGSSSDLEAHRYLDQDGMGDKSSGDRFGRALSAGDFNGDGYADLAAGAPGERIGSGPKSGVAFLFRGTASGPTAQYYVSQNELDASEDGDEFGRTLASGDFDGDGYTDLVIGAPGEAIGSGPQAGAAFLFRGSDSGPVAYDLLDQTGLSFSEHGDAFGAGLAGN